MLSEPQEPEASWILVILAAGLGTRFGGVKQLEPVGPSGEILSDYTLRQARGAGASGAVFVIGPADETAFRSHHETHPQGLPIVYVHQRLDRLPAGRTPPTQRRKPWGTTHALLCAGPHVTRRCVVVNADDYYGSAAFSAADEYLRSTPTDVPPLALVGYRLSDTVSPHGAVSRAVVSQRPDGTVERLVEVTELVADADGISGRREGVRHTFSGDEVVSMNCWVLDTTIIQLLEEAFQRFLDRGDDLLEGESRLPEAIAEIADRSRIPIHVLPGGEVWMGLTHQHDREDVRAALHEEHRTSCS